MQTATNMDRMSLLIGDSSSVGTDNGRSASYPNKRYEYKVSALYLLLSLERGKIIMRNSIRLTVLSLAAAALLLTTSAFATTATGNLSVTASVSPSCIVTGGTLAFGSYDPIVANASGGADKIGNVDVSVTCTNMAPVTVTLDAGTKFSTTRRLWDGVSGYLTYTLTSDADGLVPWGDTGFAGTITGAGVEKIGNASAQSMTVYGQIAKGQAVALIGGVLTPFTDTVVITANF